MKLIISTYNRLKENGQLFWIDLMNDLINLHGYVLYDISQDAKRLKRNNKLKISLISILKKFNDKIHEIFFFNLGVFMSNLFYDLSEIKDINIYLWIEEAWHHFEDQRICIKYCNKIFTPSPKKNLVKYFPITDQKIHELTNSASYIFDLEMNNNPINKILFSGLVSKVYPHRMEIINSCLTNDKFKNNIQILSRVGIKDYANAIHKHKASVATPGIVNNDYFIVKKFFEIPYSGSLLLIYSDKNIEMILDNIGFKNKINCIICYTIEELEKQIEFILDENNNDIINIIRKNGKEFIKNNYTINHVSKKIIDVISLDSR